MAKQPATSIGKSTKFTAPENSGRAKQGAESELPLREQTVLSMFRQYLMTPGKMLCLSNLDPSLYRAPLANLVRKKMLVAERFQNGYSLTQSGYQAMCEIVSEPP